MRPYIKSTFMTPFTKYIFMTPYIKYIFMTPYIKYIFMAPCEHCISARKTAIYKVKAINQETLTVGE